MNNFIFWLSKLSSSDRIAGLALIIAFAAAAFALWNTLLFRKFSYIQNGTSVLYNQFSKWKLTLSGYDDDELFELSKLERFNSKFWRMDDAEVREYCNIHWHNDDDIRFYNQTSRFRIFVFDYFQLINYVTESGRLKKNDREYFYRIICSNLKIDIIYQYMINCNQLSQSQLQSFGALEELFKVGEGDRDFDKEFLLLKKYLETIKRYASFQ